MVTYHVTFTRTLTRQALLAPKYFHQQMNFIFTICLLRPHFLPLKITCSNLISPSPTVRFLLTLMYCNEHFTATSPTTVTCPLSATHGHTLMSETKACRQSIDPKNGFCYETKIFHSIRPLVPLPPLSQPISITEYTLSLLHRTTTSATPTTTPDTPFVIDFNSGRRVTYSEFLGQAYSLAFLLQSKYPSLSKNSVAFILSPPSLEIPILYFSLLSLGVTISPANPLSSAAKLTHMLRLSKPVIAFTISSNADKLHSNSFPLGTILLDSPEFLSMLSSAARGNEATAGDFELEKQSERGRKCGRRREMVKMKFIC